jgi:hypothetical protein
MVYLPGSWPEEDLVIAPDDPGEETVERLMSAPLAVAAGRIAYLGDGEPGRGYVIYISESLRREPGITAVRDGDWSSLGERVVLRSRRVLGRLPGLDGHLRYAQFARRSLPVLRRLREARGIGELSLLVGIPSPLSVAAVTFGPTGAVLYERGFRQATARQIALAARLGEDVAFQVEAVLETVAVASVPPALRPAAAWAAAGRIRALAALAPPGTRFTVHLCFGSLHNRAALYPPSARPLVALANAIARRWPHGRELELVHLPLAQAGRDAATGREYYAPLGGLAVPEATRLALGIVSCRQPWPSQFAAAELARAAIAEAGPYRICVSPPCGLLSHTQQDATEITRRAVRLAEELSGTRPR